VVARLYAISVSNPARAALAMARHTRLPHRVVMLPPGFHPALVRFAGFPGWTVPALELGGRHVQGSRAISRALDEAAPGPPLFPSDPAARAAVEAAEEWGEQVLQPVPRRLFRWGLVERPDFRRWVVANVIGWPAPAVVGRLALPVMIALARSVGADEAAVRRDVEQLPELLDRVDALLAEGTIGGEQPNAADFQIASTVRVLMAFAELRDGIEGRPCARLAQRLYPAYGWPFPPVLRS
jgi:glutathione S-transferase